MTPIVEVERGSVVFDQTTQALRRLHCRWFEHRIGGGEARHRVDGHEGASIDRGGQVVGLDRSLASAWVRRRRARNRRTRTVAGLTSRTVGGLSGREPVPGD